MDGCTPYTQGIGCYLPLADNAAQLLKHPVPAALHCKPEPSLDKDNRAAYAFKHHDNNFGRAFAVCSCAPEPCVPRVSMTTVTSTSMVVNVG